MPVSMVRSSCCLVAVLSLVLASVLVACTAPADDDDVPCAALPCDQEPGVLRPAEGTWEVSSGAWVEDDECGASEQFYAPSEFQIWNVTAADLELSVLFADDPDAGQASTCILTGADFACDEAEEDIQMGNTELLMTSFISGTFDNSESGTLSFSLEVVCTQGCEELQGTWPCHAVWQSTIAASAR